MWAVFEALNRNWSLEDIHNATKSIPGSCGDFAIADLRRAAEHAGPDGLSGDQWFTLKRAGLGDLELSGLLGVRRVAQAAAVRGGAGTSDRYLRGGSSFTPYM